MNTKVHTSIFSKQYRPAIAYLMAVLFAELLDVYMAYFSAEIFSYKQNTILIYAILFFPIIFAPIQSTLADISGKKTGLIWAMLACIIGLVGAALSFWSHNFILLIFSGVLIGIWGNVQPISWAGLADFITGVRLRFYLALSICFLAVGNWGGLLITPIEKNREMFIITIIIAAFVLILIKFLIKKTSPSFVNNKKGLIEAIKEEAYVGNKILLLKKYNSLAYWSFYFSELAFYIILWRIILNPSEQLAYYPIAIGLGYSAGTFTINKFKKNNAISGEFGLVMSFFSILAMVFFDFWLFSVKTIYISTALKFTIFGLYCLFSFGYALFTPSLFSLIIPKNEAGHTGKIFGLLESVDSFSGLIAFTLVNFLVKKCPLFVIYFTSFILVLIARLIFKKLTNDHFNELNELEDEIIEDEIKNKKK